MHFSLDWNIFKHCFPQCTLFITSFPLEGLLKKSIKMVKLIAGFLARSRQSSRCLAGLIAWEIYDGFFLSRTADDMWVIALFAAQLEAKSQFPPGISAGILVSWRQLKSACYCHKTFKLRVVANLRGLSAARLKIANMKTLWIHTFWRRLFSM